MSVLNSPSPATLGEELGLTLKFHKQRKTPEDFRFCVAKDSK